MSTASLPIERQPHRSSENGEHHLALSVPRAWKARKSSPPSFAVHASRSAPAALHTLGAHLPKQLPPILGERTTLSTEAIFERLQVLRNLEQHGDGAERLFANLEINVAKDMLLRRSTPQAGDLQTLADAPVARALETIMVDEVMRQMPRPLLAPMAQLSSAMASLLFSLQPQQADAVFKGMVVDLKKEHPRPWGRQVPLLHRLVTSDASLTDKREWVTAFLENEVDDSHAALGAMVINRSLFLGFKAAGLDSTFAPFLKTADRAYSEYILIHKGNHPNSTMEAPPEDANVGITRYDMASPVTLSDPQVGTRASLRYLPNLENSAVQHAISFGNPHSSGVSGSANMFLHAASYFNTECGSHIDGRALITLLATQLCYNGGHSLHETLVASSLLTSLPGLNLSILNGYHAGHARRLFADLATSFGAEALTENSFERLNDHFEMTSVNAKGP